MAVHDWLAPVLRLRHEMCQESTVFEASLQVLPEVKVVVFDVYGTLVISGSGDVGSSDPSDHTEMIGEALEAVGITSQLSKMPTTAMLHEEIETMHRDARNELCPKPEVDIVEVWRRVLIHCGFAWEKQSTAQVVELAAQYEARANPTWPMPGSRQVLAALQQAGMPMGIVSNAQVFTPPLVESLLESENLTQGGFDLNLCFFSNRFRQSKPGARLFDALREALRQRGILPYEAVYVGNDMLNDVWAASQAGLRTAWFAGDVRSARVREDDPRCRSLRPDVVLTRMPQLLECLRLD